MVNALTLYSVYTVQLDPAAKDVGSSFLGFFKNIGILADKQHQAAVILSGMLFTLVIWVFAALSLILAILFYIFFLWHYIPNSDGGLTGYCERKINGRLTKIVSVKVNKALQEEERKNRKAAQKAAKKGEQPVLGRQATIPTLFAEKSDDKLPAMPMLHRNDTMTTLPLYTSRPGTAASQNPSVPSSFELSNLDQKRPNPSRTETDSSGQSYSSNVPLMGAASDMGYARAGSPAPSLPSLDTKGYPFPQRTMTGTSNGSQWQRDGPQPNRGPPSRQMTQDSFNGPPRQMTPGYPQDQRGPPSRQMTQDSFSDRRGPPSRQMTQDNFTASPIGYGDSFSSASPRPQGNTMDSYGRPIPRPIGDLNGRNSPAPSLRAPGYPSQRAMSPSPFNNGSVVSSTSDASGNTNFSNLNPNQRSASAGIPNQGQPPRPYRNMTEPVPQPGAGISFSNANGPPRLGTPQGQMRHERVGSSGSYDPYRSASPASFNGRPGPGPQQQGPGPYQR